MTGTTSSITVQSLGEIEQRAPAVWQPAGFKFTQCISYQKLAFSLLQEKLCVESKNDGHLLELS